MTEVRWSDWNHDELARVQGLVRDPALSAWVADGGSPSAWLVAGPQLVRRFDSSRDDEDHPVRYALLRTVLDWYSTGIGQPMPKDLARTLSALTLGQRPRSGEFKKSLKWCRRSVVGSGRPAQALLSKVGSGTDLTVHQYLQDADAKGPRSAVPDPIWRAALEHTASDSGRSRIGFAAAVGANAPMAYEAWLRLAEQGDVDAMYNLGVLVEDDEPAEARRWYERAAAHDHTGAMFKLGVLVEYDEPAEARRWYERAAAHDHAGAMFKLGVLVEDDDPAEARRWYERAAAHDHTDAMYNLGVLLEDSDPVEAPQWYERAAAHDHAGAMYNLGDLLRDGRPRRGPALVRAGGRARPRRRHVQPRGRARRQRPHRGPALVRAGGRARPHRRRVQPWVPARRERPHPGPALVRAGRRARPLRRHVQPRGPARRRRPRRGQALVRAGGRV